jgi:hypothetical protein
MILPHDSQTNRAKRSKISRNECERRVAIRTDILAGTVFRQKPGFTLNMEVVSSSKTLVTADTIHKATM